MNGESYCSWDKDPCREGEVHQDSSTVSVLYRDVGILTCIFHPDRLVSLTKGTGVPTRVLG